MVLRIHRALFGVLLLIGLAAFAAPASAAITSLNADRNTVFAQTPTPVRFVATIESDPKLLRTSVQLLREGAAAGSFSVVGVLNDNGTGGDQVANDGQFSLLLTLNEPVLRELKFQASAAYRGVVQRVKSGFFQLSIVPDVNLSVSAGEPEVDIELNQFWSTAFTVQVQKKATTLAQVSAVQVLSPATSGVGIVTDLPPTGWTTTAQTQAFLVQSELQGLQLGDYTLTLRAQLNVAGQLLEREASILVHVTPRGGRAGIALSSSPGGLQIGTSRPVLFGAHFAGGSRIPQTVALTEVTSTGAFVRTVGAMSDDGLGADLSAADELYSIEPTLTAGPSLTRLYFRAVATLADGATVQSGIRSFPILPYSMGFTAPLAASLRTDAQSGIQFFCDRLLVQFVTDTPLTEVEAAAAAVNATIIGAEPAIDAYQFAIPCGTAPQVGAAITQLFDRTSIVTAQPDFPVVNLQAADPLAPNDSYYSSQYAPKLARADEAWVLTRGGPVIAVIDSGIDYTHPDLSGHVLLPNKCDAPPGVQVKLCPKFVGKPKAILGPDYFNGDADPLDDVGHGTHVAGIAAAIANNFYSVAGVSWQSPILAIKVNGAGLFGISTTLSAYSYATPRAKIFNMSYGHPVPASASASLQSFCFLFCGGFRAITADEVERNLLQYAVNNGVLPVAAAGNYALRGNPVQWPCAWPMVLCVGSTTSNDVRSSFSEFGSQVDIAAPGSNIVSTWPGLEALETGGTSMASPFVAGAAALVWARHPTWAVADVRRRLLNTGMPLPGAQIGNRVDVFEAVFNGGFEDGMAGARPKSALSQGITDDWFADGTRSAIQRLGPLSPPKGRYMGMLSTGPTTVNESELFQALTIQPGLTELTIKFDYAMLTEEYPEFVGLGFNDDLTITLEGPCAPTEPLVLESVDGSTFTPIEGINFPDGDDTVGWTGWKTGEIHVPLTESCQAELEETPLYFRLVVHDRGDGFYDTNLLIDNIRFK